MSDEQPGPERLPDRFTARPSGIAAETIRSREEAEQTCLIWG